TSKVFSPKAATIRLASTGPMPRTMPEPMYLSIPSAVVGGVVFRKSALNWSPCARSVIQTPTAWMNSPAEIDATCPTTGTRSRFPRAFTFRTAKPLSSLWKVTRSTEPTSVSLGGDASRAGFNEEDLGNRDVVILARGCQRPIQWDKLQ